MKETKLFIKNSPSYLKINPDLANEIGLNESIILLHFDFLISISTSENIGIQCKRRENHDWFYKSIYDLQEEDFPFWSESTINRTIRSLQVQQLIIVDNFNKAKYDKTRWFALDLEGCSKLKSIMVPSIEIDLEANSQLESEGIGSTPSQNDSGSFWDELRTNQNDSGSEIDES